MQKKNNTKSVRLTRNVIPLEYDITLQPDLQNFTFQGFEEIKLLILEPTKVLILHSKEIEIGTVDIIMGGEKIFAKKISYDTKAQTASFVFPENILVGKVKLNLVFKGILNDKMRGFYRSRYTVGKENKQEYHMATTQFEATDARRAFPCFDEPAHKAVFHVSLVVPKGKTAISNTLPISINEHSVGYEIVKFSPTPKMSTYLLAFIVGDFEYIQSKTKKGVLMRVFTTPGKKLQAKFALGCAVKTLNFYEEYFAIPYPLPALDMIAIPDFSSGAMENWGAITYRESALLVDENNSSASNKQWVALVVAHEIAHQWFGNLVTMEWWTHLWLNEGFASYIEYLAVDKLFPKWDIWTQFSTNDLGVALRLDSLKSTHPVEVPVHHPDEIGEIFDEVSYSKGASIIRMLANYIGEKNFRDGLRYYLKKHSYKNTETIHLWQAFEKVSKKPVAKMMKNWTSKSGYPMVKASIVKGGINFSQKRFFTSPISAKKSKDKTIWRIPMLITSNSCPSFLAQLFDRHTYFSTEKLLCSPRRSVQGLSKSALATKGLDWFKVNIGETGFFRTAYSKELLERLREPIQNKKLNPRDRLGIIRDLFTLGEAGIVPTTDALEFLLAYKNEDNYTVLLEIAIGLARIEQLLATTASGGVPQEAGKALNKLIIDLFSPTIHRLGWEARGGERHTDTLLRSLVISRLGRSGDKKIIDEAKSVWKAIQKGEQINPDIRGAIYTVVASSGGMKEYKQFIDRYKKETLHEEKNRLGGVLGDFQDKKILSLVCEFAMSSNVRTQDTVGILSGVASNPMGRDIWWSFVQKNWKTLVSRYGEGGLTLARAIKGISGSPEKKHLKSFKKFFATHNAPGAKRAVEQVIERLEGNVAWLKRDGKIIEGFLRS